MTGAEFSEVDFDLLADYVGGALEGTPDESAVAALVAGDPAWRAAHEELSAGMAAVSAELGRLATEPMPGELAARLDALFAAPHADDAAPDDAAPDAGPAAGDGPVSPPAVALTLVHDTAAPEDPHAVRAKARDRRSGRRLRWATPIAVAAGAVAFVGFGLDYLAGARNDSSDSAGSASSAFNGAASAGAYDSAQAAGGSDAEVLQSGIDYTHATLSEAPESTALAAPQPDTRSPGRKEAPQRAEALLTRLQAPQARQACLDAIAAANGAGAIAALSVDYARYNGSPAIVVRFTARNGTWAWASGPACGTPAGGAATLDKISVG